MRIFAKRLAALRRYYAGVTGGERAGAGGDDFSMQVYDRVVPAQSYPTLWVLFAGVMMAILFEFCMRMVRTLPM